MSNWYNISEESQQELEALLKKYKEQHQVPTTQECLVMWKQEWKMSFQVYGAKVLRQKKYSPAWRDAVQEFGRRMHRLEHIGTVLKQRINLDGQQNLFGK